MPPEAELEEHRPALTGHCYRMLGSVVDADDAVQETMIRAWRGRGGFDGRASLRTWLYRIATNVCLDTLEQRGRRERPIDLSPAGTVDDTLSTRPRSHWLEPIPDHAVIAADDDPEAQVVLRESIRLAFVAALQVLPAKQRAALLLTEVLGWSAAEVAAALSTTVPAVNSALQRARATLAEGKDRPTRTPSPELLRRYVSAFERYDTEALAQLLTEDAVMSMPPYTLWLQGPASIRAWLEGRGSGCRGSRLVPVEASGGPAYAQYRDGGAAKTHTEVMVALSCERRAEVDELLAKALAAGGRAAMPLQDHGFMYACSFYDLDDHHWEVVWMDPAAIQG